MKILLVTANFYWSEGTIAKALVKILPDFEIYFFSIHEFKYRFDEFNELLEKVDVIHWLFNVVHLAENYKLFFREISIPQISTIHHVCKEEFQKIEEASKATLIHVVAPEWLSFIRQKTNTPIFLASLGINIESFKGRKINLYHGEGVFKIGMMGSYPGKYNRKRLDVAFDVLSELIKKNENVELILQGNGWENLYEVMESLNIKYTHFRQTSDKNAHKFFEKIHLYLCTSDYEGGPLPVLEAMACGIPVVSTDVGMASVALSKGGGILCPRGNIKVITKSILILKNNNKQYLDYANQTKLLIKSFDWKQQKNSYEELYRSAIILWEKKNKRSWRFKEKKTKAIKQRKKELIYDSSRESISLFQKGNFKQGLLISSKYLFSSKVDLIRKKMMLYRILRIIVKTK
ncbi:glycosyltransferase family 4 protein [Mangrovimonas sp. ST2L15]|uniref:glycosyltransferase family 4 protein n=1 Tax=Mangrovimonas sp. ST2L15 TaxID=1645916 RepID=UPI0006B4D1FA|nr:glycosyltransferase family 4 protein [Mangrovimonas sp. ST2L15]